MTSSLAKLQIAPESLMGAELAAKIDPASGISINDLSVTVNVPGSVQAVPTESAYLRSDWKYYGHVLASYTPLDMADVFGDYDLRLVLASPAWSTDLAALLAEIYQVRLTAADVVNEMIPTVTVNGQAYTLKASPSSTMWKGTRTVKLYFSSTMPG